MKEHTVCELSVMIYRRKLRLRFFKNKNFLWNTSEESFTHKKFQTLNQTTFWSTELQNVGHAFSQSRSLCQKIHSEINKPAS